MNLKLLLKGFCTFTLLLGAASMQAQEQKTSIINTLRFETRFDYDYHSYKDSDLKDAGGFDGKYINLVLAGDISEKFSYNYRQRILPNNGKKGFFDGTDWLYLTYKMNDNFSLSAGKQVFLIGGMEYDAAPIDVYFWSDFWNNIRCYQMGATLTYTDNSKRHNLSFQVSNSNYNDDTSSNLYAYNLIWYGNFKHLQTIYSVNMVEYTKGHYINYIALGNKINVGRFSGYVDFMNRAIGEQDKFLCDDFTIIGKAGWQFNDAWKVFAKGGYDTNKAVEDVTMSGLKGNCDIFVKPGVEFHFYGVGAEFFPLKNNDVRLHSFFAVKNAGSNEFHFNVGVTWRLDMLKYVKKLL